MLRRNYTNILKGFSLLEVILIISIFSIIFFVAFPKIIINKQQIDIFKLKSDVVAIRLGLIDTFYTNSIKGNKKYILLDNAQINTNGDSLFSNVIKHDIISSSLSKNKLNTWVKTSQYKYMYILDGNTLEFIYDRNKNTFQCDNIDEYCRKINK
jgi:general secretion pathway protein G